MAIQAPYPVYIPVRHKFAGALDAPYTIDFSKDTTWILPLNGGFQGLKVEALSLQIDNSSNSGKISWTAGGGNGVILPYSSGSMDVTNYDEITFTCTSGVQVRMDLVNYEIAPGFSNIVFQPSSNTTDMYFSSVIGLYHFNGINLSAAFTDNSSAGFNNEIANSNWSLDTSLFKFGVSSVKKTATVGAAANEVVSIIKAGFKASWTIEFFLQTDAIGTANKVSNFLYPQTSLNNGPCIGYQANAGATSLSVFCANSQSAPGAAVTPSVLTVDGLWHHIAIVAISTNVTIFIDGVAQINTTAALPAYAGTTDFLVFGGSPGAGTSAAYHMDELRITNVARYTANFTPPTAEFFNS